MIRRELPLTRDAGWMRAPFRIKHRRIFLAVSPRPVTGTVAGKLIIDSPSAWRLSLLFPLLSCLLGIAGGTRQGRVAVSHSELPGAEGKGSVAKISGRTKWLIERAITRRTTCR
jgi:hypothetical protein